MSRGILLLLMLAVLVGCSGEVLESPAEEAIDPSAFLGRWDVTVTSASGGYPSWFELSEGVDGLSGRFVGRVGSARPIMSLSVAGNRLEFSLPVQYESHPEDQWFKATLESSVLEGTTNAEDGSILNWKAVKAPRLEGVAEPVWGEPIDLLPGPGIKGWHPRDASVENTWVLKNGVLDNTAKGTDLITDAIFDDFKLHLEFNYPEASNSGVYLRGRYEVQIEDGFGEEPFDRGIGGVYGFLKPSVNAGKLAGEWQSYDIMLVGRAITIVLNGETVVDRQEIPGITGGALDSEEGSPGPLMIQGDHGPISFRNVSITMAKR